MHSENPVPGEATISEKISRKKCILCLFSLCIGLLGTIIVAQSFSDENVWRKDFLQDYLSARAILLEMDPYQPLTDLAVKQRYALPHGIFHHPNPHSPFLVILSTPYGWVSYKEAAYLNLAVEICCLLFSGIWIAQWLGLTPAATCAAVLLCFGWGAVWESLALGQTNLVVLSLLVAGFRGVTTQRDILGGLAIGGAIALKIIFWPLLLLIMIYRKTKACITVVTTLAAMHIAAAFVLGFQAVEHYYRFVAPTVASSYRAFSWNLSLWSVGWKLFEGSGSRELVGISAPPLIDIPRLAPVFSYGLVALLLCVSLYLSIKVRDIEVAYAVMVSFSLLMTPICWTHYLVVTAIPVACAARYVFSRNGDLKGRVELYLICACLLIPGPIVADFLYWIQNHDVFASPALLLAVGMLPTYGVLGAALLCYRCRGQVRKLQVVSAGRNA
jgi:hypothetical protein